MSGPRKGLFLVQSDSNIEAHHRHSVLELAALAVVLVALWEPVSAKLVRASEL